MVKAQRDLGNLIESWQTSTQAKKVLVPPNYHSNKAAALAKLQVNVASTAAGPLVPTTPKRPPPFLKAQPSAYVTSLQSCVEDSVMPQSTVLAQHCCVEHCVVAYVSCILVECCGVYVVVLVCIVTC